MYTKTNASAVTSSEVNEMYIRSRKLEDQSTNIRDILGV